MNWKKLPLRGLSITLHKRRNKNYPTDYTVRIEKYGALFLYDTFLVHPWHFKTKKEAIEFIAKKLTEENWTD
jgi:hypothetical protein